MQENHYYPFGLQLQGPWNTNPGRDNKYTYNGKELNEDFGLDWLDYGFRWYDPTIARFPSVDPIIEEFPYLNPYNYASNNPITNIDLYGLQGLPFFKLSGRAAVTQGTFGAEVRFIGAKEGAITKIDVQDLISFEGSFDTKNGIEASDPIIFNDDSHTFGISGGDVVGGALEFSANDSDGSKTSTSEIDLGFFFMKTETTEDKDGQKEQTTSIGVQIGASGGTGVLGFDLGLSAELILPEISRTQDFKSLSEHRNSIKQDNTRLIVPLPKIEPKKTENNKDKP